MAIYFKDEYASPTQMYGPRAYVTANGSTVIASSGLSSLANSSTGRYRSKIVFRNDRNDYTPTLRCLQLQISMDE